MTFYPITPVAKPRQTRSDKWKQRPCVMRYRAFADECRLRGVDVPDGAHVTFGIPMPASWSNKKRLKMITARHHKKPDVDNLLKALLDAVHPDDSHISDIRVTKVWAAEGWIAVEDRL
tara:strand:- start:2240 stop:2593 length:354 start_codon:yes stop_codon:yes gene_type:complete